MIEIITKYGFLFTGIVVLLIGVYEILSFQEINCEPMIGNFDKGICIYSQNYVHSMQYTTISIGIGLLMGSLSSFILNKKRINRGVKS